MKIFKLFSFLFLLTLVSTKSYSQISVGGQLSYLSFMKGSEVKNTGLGLNFDYSLDDQKVIVGGFDYYFPFTNSYEFTASANSSETTPQNLDVEVEGKISWFHIHAGMKYYFSGEWEEGFGFYGLAGLGYLSGTVKQSVESYDEDAYDLGISDGDKEKINSLTINIGVGAQFDLDFAMLFADLKLMLPPNDVNSREVSTTIDPAFNLCAGLRFPF